MICPNCNKSTHRLVVDKHGSYCATCRGLSETGGPNTTGILTRNSDRVRAQQQRYEGDMITPHRFDKQLGRFVPNEDFLERFPEQIPTYFTDVDLKKAGYSKPDKIFERRAAEEAQHAKDMEVEFAEDKDDSKIVETVGALD